MDKTLGIVGGLGPAASNYFADLLTKYTRADSDQEHLRVIHFNNPAVPDRTAYISGKGDDPVPELRYTIRTLENAGATHLCIPCNTAHAPQILDRLTPHINAQFINIIDATMDIISISEPTGAKIAVLGTEGTSRAGTYRMACESRGFAYRPLSANTQAVVSATIYKIKSKGVDKSDALKLADVMRKTPADVFVLGCTELSLLYEHLVDIDSSLPFIDSLRSLAHKVIEELTQPINHVGEKNGRIFTRNT